MKVSIIIPTYNHCNDLLIPCVNSVINYTNLDYDTELIIVANGCTDNTIQYINSLDKNLNIVLLEFKDPLGYTKAINEGIKVSKGEYVVVLNNDTYLMEQRRGEWINILINPFMVDEKMAVTGPLLLDSHGARPGQQFVVFFCAMIKTSLLTEFGGLDEIFSPGGCEDIDFCLKAIDRGYKIQKVPITGAWFPIYHQAEGTMNDNPGWQKIFDRNVKILCDRYKGEKDEDPLLHFH
jgi:GT2 family glycosyltransferase